MLHGKLFVTLLGTCREGGTHSLLDNSSSFLAGLAAQTEVNDDVHGLFRFRRCFSCFDSVVSWLGDRVMNGRETKNVW